MASVEARLDRLVDAPPAVLLLEGGSEGSRLAAAARWARALNCENKKDGAPCGDCAVCRRIEGGEHLDVWRFDGRISNKDDDEHPGPIAALRIENIRKLKAAIGVRPRDARKRVVIIQGMSPTREEALNTLLKTLEEPGEFTNFVLLAPQRGQILPTLVSRSFCVSLPWEGSFSESGAKSRVWEDALASFIERGDADFLEKVAGKGQMDAVLGADLLKGCQRSLARAVAGAQTSSLDRALGPVAASPENFALCCRWLSESQDALAIGVTPARVLEALASRLYCLRRP